MEVASLHIKDLRIIRKMLEDLTGLMSEGYIDNQEEYDSINQQIENIDKAISEVAPKTPEEAILLRFNNDIHRVKEVVPTKLPNGGFSVYFTLDYYDGNKVSKVSYVDPDFLVKWTKKVE